LERRLDRLAGLVGGHANWINNYAHLAYIPALTFLSLLARQIEYSGFPAKVR
jgi:hypothetical protein